MQVGKEGSGAGQEGHLLRAVGASDSKALA